MSDVLPGVPDDGTDPVDREGRRSQFLASLRDRQEAVWAVACHGRIVIDEYHLDGEDSWGNPDDYWALSRLTVVLPDEWWAWYCENKDEFRRSCIRAGHSVWTRETFGSVSDKLIVEPRIEVPKGLVDFVAANIDRPKPRRYNSTVVTYVERDGVAWLTPPEAKLYDLLKEAGWLFVPQPPFLSGEHIDRRPDFLIYWGQRMECPVLLEIDSDAHHPPSLRDADEAKERLFQSRGFQYLRFSAKKVLRESLSVMKEIRAFCEQRWGT